MAKKVFQLKKNRFTAKSMSLESKKKLMRMKLIG